MKKIILFAAVATLFLTALTSCKKAPGSHPESVVYTPPILESEHILKGITLYTGPGILELGANFTAPVRGNIRRINLNAPIMGSHVITLYNVSDRSIVASTTFNGNDIQSGDARIEVNIPVEANQKYTLGIKTLPQP